MGTLSFKNDAGQQVFGAAAQNEHMKADELLAFIKKLGLTYKNIKITATGGKVILEGDVDKQSDAEKINLAVGNIKGVESVDNKMRVAVPEPESQYYTVVSGDSLSKIAGKYYGDVQKYNIIFEANKPMLSDPDKIYPGQVLRIPAQK
ncbi:peptidoglycan-binding protein LysM [Flavobacterium sp. MFBS3-15]|uniref:peptidoglycan-binding protein LysM n=1 Tax=Flavobacterium sp. MFBS3-15 TaxID=2989816 RepID=UPI0022364FA4|nr:peptidoglycan-binding protein LysM [Flavobacterium sp. MFBS3-15]MCW4468953.1 peptidoglycan-binding protein LysM [Flavobacterium sp. MFBS3-15]